jgi:hypothetical protein
MQNCGMLLARSHINLLPSEPVVRCYHVDPLSSATLTCRLAFAMHAKLYFVNYMYQ